MSLDYHEAAELLGISRYPMLLLSEAAARLGISDRKLRRLARDRQIQHLRISSRLIRFDPVDVELYRDPTALERAGREKRAADRARFLDEQRARLGHLKSVVYFIQMKHSHCVKIGVAQDVAIRLRGLQSGNPEPLRLLCTFPGEHEHERLLHSALEATRLHGEWFSWSERLERVIEALKAGRLAHEISEVLEEHDA